MSGDNILDKILDELIDQAALLAAENLGRNFPEPKKNDFSAEHENEMQNIFRKERKKMLLKRITKYIKRAAVICLMVAVASSITLFSVEAWRIKIMNFVVEMKQTHSKIVFEENSTKGDTYTSDELTIGYLPDGFQLEKSDVKKNKVNLVFKGDEKYFIFSMNDINGSMIIDTENATIKKVMINGQEAFFSSNSNINILVWHEGEFSYRLSGTIDENEMVKIAKNTKK